MAFIFCQSSYVEKVNPLENLRFKFVFFSLSFYFLIS